MLSIYLGEKTAVAISHTMAAEVNVESAHQNDICLVADCLEEKCLNFILKNMWGKFFEFMEKEPENRENIVQFFDNMLDEDFEAYVLRRHPQYRGRFYRNVVKKWLGKIIKVYEFPKGICPNMLLSHRMGFISYVSRLYIQKNTSYCNWRDLIVYISDDCVSTQKKVVQRLCLLGMIEEAARFANDFNLDDEEDWPVELIQERQRCLNKPVLFTSDDLIWRAEDEESIEIEDPSHPYYYFPYPRPNIFMIDCKEKFQYCINHLSLPGSIIGVDLEWLTLFNTETNRDRIALIQLALLDCIYIVDVITLTRILTQDDWIYFFNRIFYNKFVTKLGYSFTQDLHIITVTFPFIDTKEFSNIIDLQTTVRKSSNVKHKGLSGLVEQYFHRPLNKAYQISCWERRPLRKCQVIYAALDAYVLLQIHKLNLSHHEDTSDRVDSVTSNDQMTRTIRDCDATNQVKEVLVEYDEDKNDSARIQESDRSLSLPDNSPISPHQFRVIVDTMLQGLGWSLRSVGVDAYIMKNNQSHKDAIALALQGDRIILTSGRIYEMLAARVGHNKCYRVATENVKNQLKNVLTHFNVRVKEEDILSRCQDCNCKTFVTAESETMRMLKEVKLNSLSSSLLSSKKMPWVSNPNASDAVETIPDPDMLFSVMVTPIVNKPEPYPILDNVELINMDTASYRSNGVAIQIETVPDNSFVEDRVFYCCISCGKVYWDGCHFKRVLEKMNGLLNITDDAEL
ncbi:exonuclease mut-7 homolog [Argonauta hians]